MASSKLFTIIFSSRAEKEITKSWEWYEEKLQGLGDRFITEVMDKIASLEQNPERYPLRHKKYREAALDIFPYL